MKKTTLTLFAATALACLPSSLLATLVIDFSPATTAAINRAKYTTSGNGLVVTTTGALDPFSLSNVFSNTADTGAIDDRFPSVVGGLYAIATDNNATDPTLYWQANGANIRWVTSGMNAGETLTMKGLWINQQSDWLALTTGQVGFDSTSILTLGTNDNGGSITTSARLVVLNNGTYFVSESQSTENLLTLSMNVTTNWSSFTATDFHSTNFSSLTYTGRSASFFDNVTGIGMYFEGSSTSTSPQFRVTNFTADVVAIPEPTTWLLFAGGLTAIVIARRRRQS